MHMSAFEGKADIGMGYYGPRLDATIAP